MHPHCVYVFDSLTANEAAKAVEDGHFNNIIQYHNNKHQHSANKPMQGVPLGPPPPPQSMQAPPPHTHMMGGHPSYGPPPPPPPQSHHHVSPPNHMQPQQQHPMGPGLPIPPPGGPHPPMQPQQQQQPYDPSISPQKLKEREVKLNRISIIAERTQPAPSTMHQMTPANQRLAQGPSQPPQTQSQQQPPPPPQSQQQQQTTQQQHQAVKQEHQLDPLSSMQAMSECPNMEPNNYQHTIHHHPPS